MRTAFDRRRAVLLLIILAAATALRLPDLDERSLWFDEGYSIALATEFPPGETITRTGHDFHPPFYFLLLRGWREVAGRSVFALRLLSVLLALAAVAGMTLLPGMNGDGGSEIVSRHHTAGLTAAALLAVSTCHIIWSQQVRMYSLGMTLAILSTAALFRTVGLYRSRWFWRGLYLLTATAFLYTHYFAVFTVFAHGLWAAGVNARELFRRGKSDRNPCSGYWPLICVVSAVVLFLPWLPVLLRQRRAFQDEFWSGWEAPWSGMTAFFKLCFPVNAEWTPAPGLVGGLFAFLAVSLVLCLLVRAKEGPLIVLCAVVPLVGLALLTMSGRSVASPRYLVFAYPFFLAAIAQAVARWVPQKLQAVTIGVLLMNSLFVIQRYSESVNPQDDTGIKGAAQWLLKQSHPNDAILVMHPCLFSSLRYYVGKERNIQIYLPKKKIPAYLGTAIFRDEDFVTQKELRGYRMIWVVDCTGYGYPAHHPIPDDWNIENESRAFRSVYFFERFVTVRRYRVRE